MQIKHIPHAFTESEQNYVKRVVLGPDVDWTLRPRTIKFYDDIDVSRGVPDRDHPFMSHQLVSRSDTDGKEGTQSSGLWDWFKPIFHRTREEMGIGYSSVLRANLNLSWHFPWDYGVPHYDHDHDVPHWNMLFYLSRISTGGTYLFEEFGKPVEEQPPFDQYSALAFDGGLHCQGFCAPGETRAIAIVTWLE
jgi:hypothetical protein